jgi:hypothetical protein
MNDTNNWKHSLSFLVPKAYPHPVSGQNIDFYPMSPNMLRKLKSLAQPIAHAVTILFADKSTDSGRTMKDYSFPGEQASGSETVIEPTPVETIRARADMRERAVNKLIDAATQEDGQQALASLVFDSCRDIFPRQPSKAQLDEFLGMISAQDLVQFVIGVAKANLDVFGPLGEAVSGAFSKKLEGLTEAAVRGVDDEQGGSDPSTNPEPMSSRTPPENQQPSPEIQRPVIPFPKTTVPPGS